jgi:hypothetical protein
VEAKPRESRRAALTFGVEFIVHHRNPEPHTIHTSV